MKRLLKKNIRTIVGILFVLAGLALLFYPEIEREVAEVEQKQLIAAFEQLGSYDQAEIAEEINEEPEEAEEESAVILKGAKGIIEIPTIDAQLMIFDGVQETALSRGVGMIEPNKEIGKNNVGLAGHRSLARGKLLNRLDEVAVNDTIYVKTKTDKQEYTVVDTFVVDRSQVDILNEKEEPHLTLVTCTPVGAKLPTDRLIVQAKLTKTDPIE